MSSLSNEEWRNAAVSSHYRSLWQDPDLQRRIDEGIRENRMGGLKVAVTRRNGSPAAGAAVRVQQVGHEFRFGANIFLLGGFPDAEHNRKYEAVFENLLNAATVPFYWKDLEPEPGQYRFTADSPKIYRRPPPDPVVAFCKARGVSMNGHTLVWDNPSHSIPTWLSPDPAERERRFRERIRVVCGRYGKDMDRWDVVNEAVIRPKFADKVPMPPDFEYMGLREADAALPPAPERMINDVTSVWNGQRAEYLDLIKRLRSRGARIDTVGLQFHAFSDNDMRAACDGRWMPPGKLQETMEVFRREIGLPLHVSEITLHSLGDSPAERAAQALVAYNFYRLWFSHPSVSSITWWNLNDGGGVAGEDRLASGLLDRNLDPKPAYEALDRLINHEWKTRADLVADASGQARVAAFYGTYRITATVDGRETERIARFSRQPAQDVATPAAPIRIVAS